VQQIAADAARTAVAGLSESERRLLAEDFISRSSKTYSFINPSEMKVIVADDPGNTNQFTVTITYDSGELPIWKLFSFALPDEVIRRDATIRLGGI
jgi:Flp pilus assembly protein TadG